MKTIQLILIMSFVILSDLTISIRYKKIKHTIVWNGLLWVALDNYLIIKYKSKEPLIYPIVYIKEKY